MFIVSGIRDLRWKLIKGVIKVELVAELNGWS